MPIPTFDEFFRPFLAHLANDGALHMREVRARLEAKSGLTPDELAQRLPSGQFTVVENRIGWASTYLFKAGLIERVARATYRITDAGRRALEDHPTGITLANLRTIPALREWLAASTSVDEHEAAETPVTSAQVVTSETIARSEQVLRGLVEEELLERVASMTPQAFEWLVEHLVVKLGYGSSVSEVTHALRRSGSGGSGADGGVDGVIKEDRLGLGQIYLQAKRWKGNVGRPEIQSFVGAMHGRAQKGVFITTSDYTREAREYATTLQGLRIRLVDGRELASLMVDCGVGVTEERVYRTYRIDSDFFEEGE
jgi:restriction system protein